MSNESPNFEPVIDKQLRRDVYSVIYKRLLQADDFNNEPTLDDLERNLQALLEEFGDELTAKKADEALWRANGATGVTETVLQKMDARERSLGSSLRCSELVSYFRNLREQNGGTYGLKDWRMHVQRLENPDASSFCPPKESLMAKLRKLGREKLKAIMPSNFFS